MKRQDDNDRNNTNSDASKKAKDHPRFSYLLPCPRRRPRVGDDFQAVIQPALIKDDDNDNATAVVTEEEEQDTNRVLEEEHIKSRQDESAPADAAANESA